MDYQNIYAAISLSNHDDLVLTKELKNKVLWKKLFKHTLA